MTDRELPTAFRDFAARKIAEASRSRLEPWTTDLDRAAGRLRAVGNDWTRRLFDGDFYVSPPPGPTRPACSLVFVQSRDGNTGADDPYTLGGGETDKHLIYEGLSQVAADAVLAGAGTIRGADIVFSVWHPELVRVRALLGKPRHPIQIVATLRGLDLDSCLLFNVPKIPVKVLTVEDGARKMARGFASRPWVQPILMARPEDIAWAFDTLRAGGVNRISAVGGRHLATRLIDAGLVQDLYLTTSPTPGGQSGTPISARRLRTRTLVRKRGTGRDRGVTFAHLALTDVR